MKHRRHQHNKQTPQNKTNYHKKGFVEYEPIVRAILDPDYFCMYAPDKVDNTQALADAQAAARLRARLRARVRGGAGELRAALAAFDATGAGALPPRAFDAGCAALGVVLSAREREWAEGVAAVARGGGGEGGEGGGEGAMDYGAFCDALFAADDGEQA